MPSDRSVEKRPLDPDEILEILRGVAGRDVVLVGGQAVAVWAEVLHDVAGSELARFGPYLSKDLDLLGSGQDARDLAARIGGKARLTSPDDSATRNTATVTYVRRHRTIVVDFLTDLAGVPLRDLAAPAVEVGLRLADGSGDSSGDGFGDTHFPVLHPILLLRSKIENVVGHLRRTDPGSVNQMRAAAVILRAYLSSILEAAETRDAQRTVRDLARFAATPSADRAFEDHGIDLADILDAVAGHPAWPDKFRDFQVVRKADQIRAARTRRLAERARRLQGK